MSRAEIIQPPGPLFAAAPEKFFPVADYDLAATLRSGQAFRWRESNGAWEGVVGGRWVWLRATGAGLLAQTAAPVNDWHWLADYLQVEIDHASVLASFPEDEPMRAAVQACRGLRLLRQDPWECLASFILSSTKQIVQIQQIVTQLCRSFGTPVEVPANHTPEFAFPAPARLAACHEAELRACKMGFRAPYLLETARAVAASPGRLESLRNLPVEAARAELLKFPGVGRKIADCVLLFAYGFQSAFPVDVWVMKALRQLYFPKRPRKSLKSLHRFSARHFGPNAGYAQQYLFHYMRTRPRPVAAPAARPRRAATPPHAPH